MENSSTIGLSKSEAQKRLAEFGLNQLSKPSVVKFWGIAWEEVREPMILLLLVVGIFYSVWGKLEDAITIFGVITALVLTEVINEFRAKKAINALSKIAAPKTKVLRNGKIINIETETVVPGDILILTTGTRVNADAKLTESLSIEVDESALTGESFSVEKKAGDQIFAGTLIVAGEGKAEVFATGGSSRFGKISKVAAEIKPPKTPLQLSMKGLTRTFVWIALFFSIAIPLLGIARGQDWRTMILTGLALSFATIPEELPIIITMILGLGSFNLSKANFLVKKIKAAETLGDATVILTDKTGTLTENKMRVVRSFAEGQLVPSSVEGKGNSKLLFAVAAQTLTEMSQTPTDLAVADAVLQSKAKAEGKIIHVRTFGNGRKTKSVLRLLNGKFTLFMTGSPEEILELVQFGKLSKSAILKEITAETQKGRRLIAYARRDVLAKDANLPFEKLERNLDFVGLISLEDPPRFGVKDTIAQITHAGIRTVMVTGDHPQTAAFIANSVGIPSNKVLLGEELDKMTDKELQKAVKEVSIFARTDPEHKYRLVRALKANGEIVAVTGDGINDTLALKGADIGVAMGVKGTDAAKEAADAVLADDNYVTIGKAIFEGRKFYDNLRKGVKYYLSVKMALILIFLIPVLLGIPLPFAPIQIIVLELFMDLAASAGFVSEPAEKTIFDRPPRDPRKKFLDAPMLRGITFNGLSLFVAVLVVYFFARSQNLPEIQAQTLAFTTWIVSHILLAFVSRSDFEPLYKLGLFTNRLMNFWALAVAAFLALVLFVPVVAQQLKIGSITLTQFSIILAVSFITSAWQEVVKTIQYHIKNWAP